MSKLGTKIIIGIVTMMIVVCFIVVSMKFGKKTEQNNEGLNAVQNTDNNSVIQEGNSTDVVENEEPRGPGEQVSSIAQSVDEHVQLMRESVGLVSLGLATDDVKLLVEQIKDNLSIYKTQLETVEDNELVEIKSKLLTYIDDAVNVSEQFIDGLEKDSDQTIKKVQNKITKLEDRFKNIEIAGK